MMKTRPFTSLNSRFTAPVSSSSKSVAYGAAIASSRVAWGNIRKVRIVG
jgi:hypothetical protein